MRHLWFIPILVSIIGCMHAVPEKWASYNEAFPSTTLENTSSLPSGCFRKSRFDKPFRDVYASAIKALSLSQINVEEEKKITGDIYAVRSAYVEGFVHKFFYRINVKELEAEKCAVTAYSKTQHGSKKGDFLVNVVIPTVLCAGLPLAADAGAGVALLCGCIVFVPVAPLQLLMNAHAEDEITLRWSPDDDAELDRIIALMRSDLLQ